MIVSAQKTVETGGVERQVGGYTYYCAEEPTSIAPAASPALIVEPGAEPVVHMEYNSSAACEAENLSHSVGTWHRICHGRAMLVGILLN